MLDMSRGLAALAVIVWHYQHFFYAGTVNPFTTSPRDLQPLYDALARLYHYGHYGVQYFWMLSGFVFTVTYLSSACTGRDFAVRRIARLYPLHLTTLLIVAALQTVIQMRTGGFSIYEHNDLYHFVLNLFFISGWGFEAGLSFNGPIWSVSVEIMIYATFFLSLAWLRQKPFLTTAAFIAAGYALSRAEEATYFGECAAFFYTGCLIFIVISAMRSVWHEDRRRFITMVSLAALCFVAVMAGIARSLPMHGRIYVMSGTAIMAMGVLETIRPIRTRGFDWVGDTSYGVYLWHVPIQLSLVLATASLGIPIAQLALAPWFLLAYILATLAVAAIGFRYIESPAQAFLLDRYLSAQAALRQRQRPAGTAAAE